MERQIENSVTGDRMIFLSSPMLGDGDTLVFRAILPPNAAGAPLHTHDAMTETFLVEDGALDIHLGGGRVERLGPGEEIAITPGTSHGFCNPLDRETRFVTTATPGADLERFLRTLYALANDGKTDASGAPRSPFALATALSRVDMTMSGIPASLQHVAVGVLAWVARGMGIERRVERLVLASTTSGEA